MQHGFRTVWRDLEQCTQAGSSAFAGRAKQISSFVEQHATNGGLSVLPSLESVKHSFDPVWGHLENRSTAISVAAGTAHRGCAIQVAARVRHHVGPWCPAIPVQGGKGIEHVEGSAWG